MATFSTLRDYFDHQLTLLPPQAQRVLVLDPPGLLALGETVEVEGRQWLVFRYDGNDLAFRRAYGHYGPDAPHLIWVTRPPSWVSPQTIDLSYLNDVVCRADGILDLSLSGVLKALFPRETWPQEALARFEPLLADHLGTVVAAYADLRRAIGPNTPLDTHALGALVLHIRHPNIPVGDFLFRSAEPRQTLARYLQMLVQEEWDEEGLALLREQVRRTLWPAGADLEPWIDAPPAGLTRYLYLRRLLSLHRVPNIAAVTRGLLPFDPRPLEPWVDTALRLWEDDPRWRQALIARAEGTLEGAELEEALELLGAATPSALLSALRWAETPAVAYALARRLLAGVRNAEELGRLALAWPRHRPITETWPETAYTLRATSIRRFLDELAFVFERLTADTQPPSDLAALVDWYVQNRLYDLEYAVARAGESLRHLPGLERTLFPLLDQVRATVRMHLDRLDRELARQIRTDWQEYLRHPRLAIHALRDTVIRPRRPSPGTSVWIVVFDGMRYDTWEQVVKPRLRERYTVEWERPYLSLLPSWTGIARTGLLAGKTPDGWRSYQGNFSQDQQVLAARLLGLSENDYRDRIRFYSQMDSDRTWRQLDPERRFPYNILVFNVSDDNLHAIRDNLVALNRVVESLLGDILTTLDALVQPDDTLIITSDHGFVELEPDQQVVIRDEGYRRGERGVSVTHRYIRGMERPDHLSDEVALTFEYPRSREGPFTVAIGRRWFFREGATRADRYAHGGLSLAEMVVPAAVLRPAVVPIVKLTVESFPSTLTVQEGEETVVEFAVVNTGNRPASFTLEVRANTAREPQRQEGTLPPGERLPVSYRFIPIYSDVPDEPGTERVHLRVEYQDAQGKRQRLSRTASVAVQPRRDVVRFSLGDLDRLDDLL